MSTFPSIADVLFLTINARYVPTADISRCAMSRSNSARGIKPNLSEPIQSGSLFLLDFEGGHLCWADRMAIC
jgi:hypothetical protein